MKLMDIWRHKESNKLIQIESYATNIKTGSDTVVVFNNINRQGYNPSFNGYGTKEEIESEYELFICSDRAIQIETYDEMFDELEMVEWKRR